MIRKVIEIKDNKNLSQVLGTLNKQARELEKTFAVKILLIDAGILIEGSEVFNVEASWRVLFRLIELSERGAEINFQLFNYFLEQAKNGNYDLVQKFHPDTICTNAKGKSIASKTAGQKKYIETIKKHTITFVNGPAGTGKTYLAVALAVQAFREQQVDRIILTRPAVEAGEKLGFLPGDLQMKLDPYMRPLYDALYDLMGVETYQRLMEKGNIEISPLAYMRGRTLDHAFIILDEAQNTSKEQMKMFLTRIGFGSKAVITGDTSQMDLDLKKSSGLVGIERILKDIEEISFVKLEAADVVRASVVQEIIKAYAKYEKNSPRG